MYLIKIYCKTAFVTCLFFLPSIAQANPVACFNTNMGNFCIELFKTQTPITADDFINYIDSGAYTNGILHRSIPSFVIQGGGFKFIGDASEKSLVPVNTLPPIINEFKISNTRGTVAMAKSADDPNSATSQWFINLADNSLNLDNQNSGFTVFGRVIFNGMDVIDAIEDLPIINLGDGFTTTPTIDFDGANLTTENFVQINHVEVTDTSGVFSEGVLGFAVDIGNGNELLEVNLLLIEETPSFIFELDPTSIKSLQAGPINTATFSSQSGQLHIPSVMINASTVVNNVIMTLTNAELFQFTLLSFEEEG